MLNIYVFKKLKKNMLGFGLKRATKHLSIQNFGFVLHAQLTITNQNSRYNTKADYSVGNFDIDGIAKIFC